MSFLPTLLGGLSGALSHIPGIGKWGNFASSLGTSIFGSLSASDQWSTEAEFNANQAQLNRDFQRSERLASQEFNLDMWNKNNEYNSPAQQLERAKAAGINPNAAIAGMSPGSSSPVTTSPMSGSTASAPGSLASSMLLQDATLANLFANTRKTNAEADNQTHQLKWNMLTEPIRYDSLITMNDKDKAEIAKLVSDVGFNDYNKDLQERMYRWYSAMSEEEVQIKKNQATLLYNQNAEKLANIKLIEEQTETEKANQNLIDEQAFT